MNTFAPVLILRIVRFFFHSLEGRSVGSAESSLGRVLAPSASRARRARLPLRTVALEVPIPSTLKTLVLIRRHPVQNIEIFARSFLLRCWSRQYAAWSPYMGGGAFLGVSQV